MTETRATLAKEASLFQSVPLRRRYPFFSTITLGLMTVYQLSMDPDKIYVVDVDHNDFFIYDRESARGRHKFFWKLTLAEAPECVSLPRRLDVQVKLPEVPSFDQEYGERGAWVTMEYEIRILLEVRRETIGCVHRAINPVATVRNAALRAARRVLPFLPYQEALIAQAEEDIQEEIFQDAKVSSTGLEVIQVEIGDVAGSKKLSDALQTSFGRLLQARDRREIAISLAQMDQGVFDRMIESEAPAAYLAAKSRASDQMLQALLVQGLTPLQIHSTVGKAIGSVQQPESMAAQVAGKAFQQITAWPQLRSPENVSHEQRLKWEREVIQDRIPTQLQETGRSDDTFTILLETGNELVVVWSAPDFPPEVYIDGQDRRSGFIVLRKDIYDYHRTTVWDLYLETRRLLGVQTGSQSGA